MESITRRVHTEKAGMIENINSALGCGDGQSLNFNEEELGNRIKEKQQSRFGRFPITSSVDTNKIPLTRSINDNISKSSKMLTKSSSSLLYADCLEPATELVDHILDEAHHTVFGKVSSFQYIQEECKKNDTQTFFLNEKGMDLSLKRSNDYQSCLELDELYPEVGLTSSSLNPSLNEISALVSKPSTTLKYSLKTGAVKRNHFDSLEKHTVLNNVQSSNTNEPMAMRVCSLTKKPRISELDFTILSDILSNLESIPSYLLNKMCSKNLSEHNRNLLIFLPKTDNVAGPSLQTQRSISLNSTLFQTWKNVESTIVGDNILALETSTTSENYISHPSVSSCFKFDTSKNILHSVNKSDNLQLNPTKISDQTLPSVFISELMHNVSKTRRDDPVKIWIISAQRVWCLQYNKWDSSASKASSSFDQGISQINANPTYDSNTLMPFSTVPMFSEESRRTVIEQNLEINYNNCIASHKLLVNSAKPQSFENSSITIIPATELKVIHPLSTICELISMSNSTTVPSNCVINKGKEDIKPSSIEDSDVRELFDSFRSDTYQGKESCAETALNRIVKDRVSVEQPLFDTRGEIKIDDSGDDDELDRIIDDSIKKYETFTVDASTLATPTTAEKSCQTELFDTESLARCKRCLEFEDQPTETTKKIKLDLNNKFYNRPDISYRHAPNNSSIQSTNYDQIHNDHKMLVNTTNPDQQGPSRFFDNFEDLLVVSPFEGVSGSVRSDETHDLDYEGSLFDEDSINEESNQVYQSNDISCNTDQEVPENQQPCEGLPPPRSLVTPKKPIIRVGLSRSARFKPLHRRM